MIKVEKELGKLNTITIYNNTYYLEEIGLEEIEMN